MSRSCFSFAAVVELLDNYQAMMAEQDEKAADAIALSHYQISQDVDDVDVELITHLLAYIRRGGEDGGAVIEGAILVFLPGWDDIIRLKDMIERHPEGLFRRAS